MGNEDDDSTESITAHNENHKETQDEAAKELTLSALLWLSFIAICNEAAPFICISVQTALLARKQGSDAVAAFSAVQAVCQFGCGLFNFLVLVVMNHTSKAIGARAWQVVRQRVMLAVASALVSGAVCAGLLFILRQPIFQLLDLEPRCEQQAHSYFGVRALTTPLLLLNRVITGTLCGLQQLRLAAVLNILGAVVEAMAAYIALYPMHSDLEAVGWASLICSAAMALVGLVCVKLCVPDHSELPKQQSGTLGMALVELPRVAAPPFDPTQFFKDSADMMIRSFFLQSSVWALSICAARLGSDVLTAHHLCMLLWMLTSYVIDGYADVGLMLGAKYLGGGQFKLWQRLCRTLAILGLSTGCGCAAVMWLMKDSIIRLLLDDITDVTRHALDQVWLLIALMQITNSVVFTYDGLLAAASQFSFVRNSVSFGVIVLFAPMLAVGDSMFHTLLSIWVAKAVLNTWRCVSSVVRINVCLWPQWDQVSEDLDDALPTPAGQEYKVVLPLPDQDDMEV